MAATRGLRLLRNGLFGAGTALLLVGVAGGPWATSKSVTCQVVRRATSTDALFGDQDEMIGSPQVFFNIDPQALVPNRPPGGVPELDEQLVMKHGGYPLQLKSVQQGFFALMIGGSTLLLAAGLVSFWIARRRPRSGASLVP